MRKRFYLVAAAAALLGLAWLPITAHNVRVTPGGAPPPGSGPLDITGPVRVIDGDTIEVQIKGNRVGIALSGIVAPQGNTPCGKEASALLMSLTSAAGLRLEEDPAKAFDSKKRRVYRVSARGKQLASELLRSGAVDIDLSSSLLQLLLGFLNEAKDAKRGCLWRGNPSGLKPFENMDELWGTSKADMARAAEAEPRTAVEVPSGFLVDNYVSGLVSPTAFTFLPDGRILIAEQSGRVMMFKNGALLSTPFLDIRSKVNGYWDRGLLGIAADPNFATNGYVYVLYVYENDPLDYSGTKTARLSRFTASGDTALPASELTVLGSSVGKTCKDFPSGADCIPADGPSHAVGNIKFASDGTMFVTIGDGTPFNVVDPDALRAQDLNQLSGKVLHITTSGQGVPGNPFWTGVATANRSKVWSYGLRNPYRFNLRPGSTKVYLGDVGWSSYEELNIATAGANFGWPCYEGEFRQAGYEPEGVCQALYAQGASAVKMGLQSWAHQGGSSAATGGAFYTGTAYPAEYQGSYFYADYGQSLIRNLRVDASDNVTGGPFDFARLADGPVALEVGPDQNLYYLAIETGQLRRIRYSATSDASPPTVTDRSPAPGASGILRDATVTATFSEAMHATSFTGTNVYLLRQGSGTPIPATVSYNATTRQVTLTPSSALTLASTYTATLKGGFGGIADAAGNPLTSDVTWTFTTAVPPPNGTTYLSDLPWSDMTNGWGPAEKDKSNGDIAAGDGLPLKIEGQTYAKGLGTHAGSEIRYFVGSACSTFQAEVGMDDEAMGGSVVFQVWADGAKLFDSGIMYDNAAAVPVNVSLASKEVLTLIVGDGGNGIGGDHGDWGNARITCNSGGDTSAPTVVSTNPAPSATEIAVGTSVSGTFSEAMNASTVTSATFTLVRQGTTTSVPATVAYDSSLVTATLTPSSSLAQGAVYTATLKGGASGVKDLAGNAMAANRVWTFTTSATAPPSTRFLSDMTWTSAQSGWGPVERDKSNGDLAAGDGTPIVIRGVSYAKGLGTHSTADVRFNLDANCSSFNATVGIDDITPSGSVIFQVWADGAKLYDSGTVYRGTPAQAINVNVTGKNELRLVVNDGGDGNGWDHADWGNARVTCVAGNSPPVPTINTPSSTLRFKVGDVISFSGSAIDPEDGTLPPSALSWQVKIHHCVGSQCHQHNFITAAGANGSFTVPDHGDEFYFEIVLTATDSGGVTGASSVSIQGQTSQLTLASSPPGLQLVLNGVAQAAPIVANPVVGSALTIYAPPQSGFTFTSWSDGGAAQHNITIGASNVTHTATYADASPPTVVGISPTSGATGVALNATVNATFSEPMLASSITATTFQLTPQGGTTPVPATVTYNATNRVATLTPTANLAINTVYTATLLSGASGVKDASNNTLANNFTWNFTTSAVAPPATRYLSDMTWTSATNGWGPVERDKANGDSAAGDGGPLRVGGVTYAKGLGTHAPADIRIALNGACSTFNTSMAVDDYARPNGSVVYQVWADNVKIYDSGVVYGWYGIIATTQDLTGKNELRLVVTDGGDGIGWDHADWLDARVTCAPDTTPPTVASRNPASGATGVARGTSVTATFSEALDPSTVTGTNAYLTRQGTTTPVAATVTYDATARRITLDPSSNLAGSSVYTVTLRGGATGIKDLAGNALATNNTWNFTTQ